MWKRSCDETLFHICSMADSGRGGEAPELHMINLLLLFSRQIFFIIYLLCSRLWERQYLGHTQRGKALLSHNLHCCHHKVFRLLRFKLWKSALAPVSFTFCVPSVTRYCKFLLHDVSLMPLPSKFSHHYSSSVVFILFISKLISPSIL